MTIITFIFGLIYFILGINFYKGRFLELINGIDINKAKHHKELAKNLGSAYIVIGSLLFLEALAYKSLLISKNVYVIALVITVIVGPIIMTQTIKRYV